jgi:hypothetical protein
MWWILTEGIDDFGLRIAACDEPFGCELRAERLSRVDFGFRIFQIPHTKHQTQNT